MFLNIKTVMGRCGIVEGEVFLLGGTDGAFSSLVGQEENASVEEVDDGDEEEAPSHNAYKETRARGCTCCMLFHAIIFRLFVVVATHNIAFFSFYSKLDFTKEKKKKKRS